MLPLPAGREASAGEGAVRYARHRPERTLLYQLVKEYYPAFVSAMAAQGTALPAYVQREGAPAQRFIFVKLRARLLAVLTLLLSTAARRPQTG